MNIPVRCKIFDNNMMGDQLPMSALGQKQTFAVQNGMSALPPKADMGSPTNLTRGKLFSRQYPFSSVDIRSRLISTRAHT
jgi:hypothetical protein